MEHDDVGSLLNEKAIKFNRVKLVRAGKARGIQPLYYAPLDNKHWNTAGELETYFYPEEYNAPRRVSCFFVERPNQKTAKAWGWDAELSEGASLIQVPYGTPHLQIGCVFALPSYEDDAPNRLFRVISMQVNQEYPSHFTCEVALVYEDTTDKSSLQVSDNTGTILVDGTPEGW